MDYVELQIRCNPAFRDILIAELGVLGYDSMLETDQGLNACIIQDSFQESALVSIREKYRDIAPFDWETEVIPEKNWNEEWERAYDPVVIDDKCVIRASFHAPVEGAAYEIIIDPKMSFGTGHHETTVLMIKMQMQIDHNGKRVLDCGCGTGVLSIMASRLNAETVLGIDIDDRAIQNSIENARLNQVQNLTFRQGSIDDIQRTDRMDIIYANINRNILLHEMRAYARHLRSGGTLLLSGFYVADLDRICEGALKHGLAFVESESMNEWASARFIRD